MNPADATAKMPAAPRRSARAKAVEAAAQTYFDAIAARDPDAMAACFAPSGIDDIVPLGVFRGPEAVRKLFGEMFRAMPDVTMTVDRIVADHGVAAVQWRLAGTFDGGPFQGIEPTGRRVELRGADLLDIDEQGLIIRNTGFYDGAAFARAVGLLPPQDGGVDKAMLAGFNAVTKLRKAVVSR
jgi:predicted ester cyclase